MKAALIDALEEIVDSRLGQSGFGRRKDSTVYTRKQKEAKQSISFVMDLCSPIHSRSVAHIHPMFILEMPILSEEALRLTGGDREILVNAPEIIINEPIEFAAPKDKHQRWFIDAEHGVVSACDDIGIFIERWVLPLLGELTDVASFVRLYEGQDSRLIKQRHFYIFIAAAYVLLGDRTKAQEIIKDKLHSPGLKRRYQKIFAELGL